MTRDQKLKRDKKTLEKYAKRLKEARRCYIQTVTAIAVNQRKSRRVAAGECVLQAMDQVRALAKTKMLMDGSLEFMITEKKLIDPDGKKGFEYGVTYKVTSWEPNYTEDEIRENVEKLAKQLQEETDEMFPET